MAVELSNEELGEGAPIAAKIGVIPQFEAAWLLLPKVASTSIKHELRPFRVDHLSRSEVMERYPDFKRVAIVRNPFDRLVSCWSDKIMNPKSHAGWAKRYYQHLPNYQGMPFEEFVKNVCDLDDDISDRHYRSQVLQLEWNGEFLPQLVGKVENLQQALNDIADFTGIPIKKPHIVQKNKSWYPRKNYREYYTDETRKLVEKKFERDLDILEYTF